MARRLRNAYFTAYSAAAHPAAAVFGALAVFAAVVFVPAVIALTLLAAPWWVLVLLAAWVVGIHVAEHKMSGRGPVRGLFGDEPQGWEVVVLGVVLLGFVIAATTWWWFTPAAVTVWLVWRYRGVLFGLGRGSTQHS